MTIQAALLGWRQIFRDGSWEVSIKKSVGVLDLFCYVLPESLMMILSYM